MASTSRANSQDWQSYLNQFNKEIEDGESDSAELIDANVDDPLISIETHVQIADDNEAIVSTNQRAPNNENVVVGEIGTYFVDQEGNYYFQTTKNCIEQMTGEPPAGVSLIKIKVPPTPKETKPPADNEIKKRTTRSSNKIDATKQQQCLSQLNNKQENSSVEYVFVLKEEPLSITVKENENIEDIETTEIFHFNDNDVDDEGNIEHILPTTKPDNNISNNYNTNNVSASKESKHKVVRVRVNKKPATNFESNGIIYACNYCDYASYKRHLLARHIHGHTDERPYKCSVCERGFKTKVALLNHVNAHLGNKPHGCKYCTKAFTTAGELVRHVRYKHTGEKPHKCTECDYTSVEMSKLRRHMRCHTGERPYQCPHCTYASPDTFKLKRHLRTHTGEKPYECDICHARFTQSNSLKSHRLIHSVGDKPVFQCQYCPTTCGRKTDLRSHILNLHTSDKPIPCKRCGQNLADRYSYKMHIKTHDGEKCFRCNVCPYASSSMRHLRAHTLVHTDEKPYVCEHCDLAFRQPALLKRHQNLYHTKDYVPPKPREKLHACPHCKRRFTHNGNLMRHMEMHDPESNALNIKVELKKGRMKRLKSDDDTKNVGSELDDNANGVIAEDDEDNEEIDEIEKDVLDEAEEDEEEDEEGNIISEDDMSPYDNYERFEVVELEKDNTAENNIDLDNMDDIVDDSPTNRNQLIVRSQYSVSLNTNSNRKKSKIETTTTNNTILNKKISGALDNRSKLSDVKKESEDKEYVAVELGDDSEYMVVEVIKCVADGDDNDNDIIITDNISNDCANEKNSNIIKIPVANNNIKHSLKNCFDFQEDIDMEFEDDGDNKESIQFLDFIEEY